MERREDGTNKVLHVQIRVGIGNLVLEIEGALEPGLVEHRVLEVPAEVQGKLAHRDVLPSHSISTEAAGVVNTAYPRGIAWILGRVQLQSPGAFGQRIDLAGSVLAMEFELKPVDEQRQIGRAS